MRIAVIILMVASAWLVSTGCEPAMYDIRNCTNGEWVKNPLTSCAKVGDDCSLLAYQSTFDDTRSLLNTCKDKNTKYTCGMCVATGSNQLACSPVFAQTKQDQGWVKPNSCVITYSCDYGPSNIDSCWANCIWDQVTATLTTSAVIPYGQNPSKFDQFICDYSQL